MSYSSNYDMSPKSVASSNSNESISSFSHHSQFLPYSQSTTLTTIKMWILLNFNTHSKSLISLIQLDLSQNQYRFLYLNKIGHHTSITTKWTNVIKISTKKNTIYNNNNQRILPKRSENIDLIPLIKKSEISKQNGGKNKMCSFSKSNGESEEVYTSHNLKDDVV